MDRRRFLLTRWPVLALFAALATSLDEPALVVALALRLRGEQSLYFSPLGD
jgi:hypothetical protein